jgi:hypothetical protein
VQYFNPDKVNTSDFQFRDISADELRGMFDMANYIIRHKPNSSKHERKLARYLLKACYWIEREAYLTVKGIANGKEV